MTAAEIVEELKPLGSENTRKVLMKHGIPDPVFGVKIEELKKILKRTKKNYPLALELYDTGIYDAMYLAGLMVDDAKMTKKDLKHWAKTSTCNAISTSTVPSVAAESEHGWEMGLEWIESKTETIAVAGWSTLGFVVSLEEDADLDLIAIEELLHRVEKNIHKAQNRVRASMNHFVIAVGGYVKPLSAEAIRVAKAIGKVDVDVGDTACKIPDATEYIQKMIDRGSLGKKRKTAKC